jgi:thioredoxin 1
MAQLLKSLWGEKERSAAGVLTQEGTPGALPVHVTDDTFEEMVLNSRVPVLVDFWAPWCGPCRMIAPVVEDLAESYQGRAQMAKVNTDENPGVAMGLGIMGIPTLVLFKDGQEVDRVVGFVPRRTLENKLDVVLGQE